YHGRRFVPLLAAVDDTAGAGRPGDTPRPGVDPADIAHRGLGERGCRRAHRAALGPGLLNRRANPCTVSELARHRNWLAWARFEAVAVCRVLYPSRRRSPLARTAAPLIATIQQLFSEELANETYFLREENKILRSKLGKRVPLTDVDRRTPVRYG